MNSKKKCKLCREYFLAEEVVKTNIGNFCSVCIKDARKPAGKASLTPRKMRAQARRKPKRTTPQELKDGVRKRDGHRCRWCGTSKTLEVHHVQYLSQGGPDHEHNLVTLCKTHHDKAHSHKGAWQKTLQLLIWVHYSQNRRMAVPTLVRQLVGSVGDNEVEDALAKFWREDGLVLSPDQGEEVGSE